MEFDKSTFRITQSGNTGKIALIIGVAGLLLSLLGFFVDKSQFLFSWLTSFTFWVSIGFGGLFFVLIHHMVGAMWSAPIRRISENVMATLPWMILFVIPIFIGMSDLYEWVDIGKEASHDVHTEISHDASQDSHDGHGAEVVEHHNDEMAHHGDKNSDEHHAHQAHVDLIKTKTGYLNVPFFIVRTLIYFGVWTLLAFVLWRKSIRQDFDGFHPDQLVGFRKASAPGLIGFAFTVTFAGFDWMMSLFPAWYSTIYGLYYFAGGLMSILAFLAIVTVSLKNSKVLDEVISAEHYHDIGKLMFAFMVVWAYFAFSQYLLIWYANIPEETIYYHQRWVGGWKFMSVFIVLGHFLIPFILLMSRHVKRNQNLLRAFAVWLLAMHWLDLYWNIMPVLHPTNAMPSWLDLTTMMGIGGIFVFLFWKRLTSHAVVALNDPKLEESINFKNI